MTGADMIKQLVEAEGITVTSLSVEHEMIQTPNDHGSYDVERGTHSTVTFTIERAE